MWRSAIWWHHVLHINNNKKDIINNSGFYKAPNLEYDLKSFDHPHKVIEVLWNPTRMHQIIAHTGNMHYHGFLRCYKRTSSNNPFLHIWTFLCILFLFIYKDFMRYTYISSTLLVQSSSHTCLESFAYCTWGQTCHLVHKLLK